MRVDTAALRAAGSGAQEAASNATPGTDHVQPCAPDFVSVGASASFGAQLALARQYTRMAHRTAQQFGVLLDAGARVYDEQEASSAAMLGATGLSRAGAGIPVPPVVRDAAAVLDGGTPSQPPGVPAGEVPVSPRDIARLIDTGRTGSGQHAWLAVAESLRRESGQLERAAHQLAAAIATAQRGWESRAADSAVVHMRSLQCWFEEHARYVSTLSAAARGHVEAFRTAAAEIPKLSEVARAERELRAANDANARSRGRLQPAVARAQVRLSKLYTQSADGLKNYIFAAGNTSPPPVPSPPPLPPTPHPDPVPAFDPGDAPVAHKIDKAPVDAPLDPVDEGGKAGEDALQTGKSWPTGGLDPDTDFPVTDALPDAAGMAPQILPAMLGTVMGGAGGALGGLIGAGSKAMAMPASMTSGFGAPSGGVPQQGGGEPEQSAPQPDSEGGDAAPDSGGGEPGDTEPAGGQGALTAPPGVPSAPVEAAPVSAPVASSAVAEPAAGVGAPMGGMMPPMMGGGRGGGPGAGNKQLYKDRELKVAVPPNSEPVKGRREARGTKDGAGK